MWYTIKSNKSLTFKNHKISQVTQVCVCYWSLLTIPSIALMELWNRRHSPPPVPPMSRHAYSASTSFKKIYVSQTLLQEDSQFQISRVPISPFPPAITHQQSTLVEPGFYQRFKVTQIYISSGIWWAWSIWPAVFDFIKDRLVEILSHCLAFLDDSVTALTLCFWLQIESVYVC